jgi:hypothetical protein
VFRRKKKPATDPAYEGITKNQIGLYQKYLDGLFAVIDVDNYTLWSLSKNCDNHRLKRDDRVMEKVSCGLAASHGLSPASLQLMLHQYFFADPWQRERYQSTWAETVVYNRDGADFFPGASNVRKRLERYGTRKPTSPYAPTQARSNGFSNTRAKASR